MFRLLDADEQRGLQLTESFAMLPGGGGQRPVFLAIRRASISWSAASVAEQVADYAKRKGVTLAQAERWLASNLDYDPE